MSIKLLIVDDHAVVRSGLETLLATTDEAICVCNLTEPLGLSQPTVSHHLKVLLQAGLVERELGTEVALVGKAVDAGIIVAAQKAEHYEIAGYGSVRTFAQLLGQDKSAELLQQTLDEESEANELLNKLAEDIVNPEALMEPGMASASSDR